MNQETQHASKFNLLEILYYSIFIHLFLDFKKKKFRSLPSLVVVILFYFTIYLYDSQIAVSVTYYSFILFISAVCVCVSSYTILKLVGFFDDNIYDLHPLRIPRYKREDHSLSLNSFANSSGNKFNVISSVFLISILFFSGTSLALALLYNSKSEATACLGIRETAEYLYYAISMIPGLDLCDPVKSIGEKIAIYIANTIVIGSLVTEMNSIVYRRHIMK